MNLHFITEDGKSVAINRRSLLRFGEHEYQMVSLSHHSDDEIVVTFARTPYLIEQEDLKA